MKSSNGQTTATPTLDPKQSFDGGYLQATGNVPISVAVAASPTVVDATMSGDWAVMVRVQAAPGIDAKALAASVDWDKSYYYLTIQSINIFPLGSVTINFPIQFDHHVYLDPDKSNNDFFLKVKGIPFWVKQSGSGQDAKDSKAQLQLQDGNADYMDYLNNRQINASANPQTASTLDNLVNADGSNPGPKTSLNNKTLTTTDVNGDTQPRFATYNHVQPSLSNVGVYWGNPLWNLYDALPLGSGKSPVYEAGPTGAMISLLNGTTSGIPTVRGIGDGLAYLIQYVGTWFTKNTFTGSAHINFSFDMAKYAAGTSKEQQALTAGRFFAAPPCGWHI